MTLPCVISAGILLTVESAEANPTYSGLLAQNVPMPCVPQCTLCHTTSVGGPGNDLTYGIETTWTNPAITMGSVIDGTDPGSLVRTLDAIRKLNPPLDSDKDGIPDLAELMMGGNPNVAGSAWLCGEDGGHGLPGKNAGAEASDSGAADASLDAGVDVSTGSGGASGSNGGRGPGASGANPGGGNAAASGGTAATGGNSPASGGRGATSPLDSGLADASVPSSAKESSSCDCRTTPHGSMHDTESTAWLVALVLARVRRRRSANRLAASATSTRERRSSER